MVDHNPPTSPNGYLTSLSKVIGLVIVIYIYMDFGYYYIELYVNVSGFNQLLQQL